MCVLATVGLCGPLATPVRYFHLDFTVIFTAQAASPKMRNIEGDPRVFVGIFAPLVGQASSRRAQLFGTVRVLEPTDAEFDRLGLPGRSVVRFVAWRLSGSMNGTAVGKTTHLASACPLRSGARRWGLRGNRHLGHHRRRRSGGDPLGTGPGWSRRPLRSGCRARRVEVPRRRAPITRARLAGGHGLVRRCCGRRRRSANQGPNGRPTWPNRRSSRAALSSAGGCRTNSGDAARYPDDRRQLDSTRAP